MIIKDLPVRAYVRYWLVVGIHKKHQLMIVSIFSYIMVVLSHTFENPALPNSAIPLMYDSSRTLHLQSAWQRATLIGSHRNLYRPMNRLSLRSRVLCSPKSPLSAQRSPSNEKSESHHTADEVFCCLFVLVGSST